MRPGKRLLALLLALALTCGVFAVAACAAAEPDAGQAGYRLIEEDTLADIAPDATPLAAPAQSCCVLHFVLMLCALAVAVCFVHDRNTRQRRIYELRRASLN